MKHNSLKVNVKFNIHTHMHSHPVTLLQGLKVPELNADWIIIPHL